MIAAVADTHAALWYMLADARLSSRAKGFMDSAVSSRKEIAVSSISLVEIVYLVEKHRLQLSVYEQLLDALKDVEHFFMEATLTHTVVACMRDIPRDQVPDMPDRIIAATALQLGVPVISRDRQIRSALLQTIW